MESISEENVIVEEKNTQETPMEINQLLLYFVYPETIFLIIFYIHGLNCLDIV